MNVSKRRSQAAALPKSPTGPGLEPYTGDFTFTQAAHLLRRTIFGPTRQEIQAVAEAGLEATLEQLFAETPLPSPPINPGFTEDPNVPVGATWVTAPYSRTVDYRPYRNRSLRSWTFLNMMEQGISIREKMTLFWVNHFGIADIGDARFLYRFVTTLRNHAWGDFRQLIKDITIDPAMLIFLNGNQNTFMAPNENYARELLELFTVGKGALAGPGDYSTFTEQDVAAMARVLTGWRVYNYFSDQADGVPVSDFRLFRHDRGSKQLSHRFDNAVIPDMGEQEYAHLIDVIFQRDQVARYICRKLYQWFVYYEVDDTVEAEVIEPMADLLIANDYQLKPVLQTLLRSAHFFNILSVGPMIKNPLDYTLSIIRQLEVAWPDVPALRYLIALRLYAFSSSMEMDYFRPPSVAGWKAYYQAPQFYRFWINAATLQLRSVLSNAISLAPINIGDFQFKFDPLEYIKQVSQPHDPNVVVAEFSQLLHPQPLTEQQYLALKDILIPGLPDFEWTVEYGDYAANPDNMELRISVENKLRQLMRALINLAEFHLS